MSGKDLFYGLTNEQAMELTAKSKIIWAYSYIEGISHGKAEEELMGVDLKKVRQYAQKRLNDQKQAIESFQRLLESIGE